MTGLARRAVVATLLALTVSGCSLVYRDGRYGGNNWDGGFDAGPGVDAPPPPDAGHDAGHDAGAPPDAGHDGGPTDAGPSDGGVGDAPAEDAT